MADGNSIALKRYYETIQNGFENSPVEKSILKKEIRCRMQFADRTGNFVTALDNLMGWEVEQTLDKNSYLDLFNTPLPLISGKRIERGVPRKTSESNDALLFRRLRLEFLPLVIRQINLGINHEIRDLYGLFRIMYFHDYSYDFIMKKLLSNELEDICILLDKKTRLFSSQSKILLTTNSEFRSENSGSPIAPKAAILSMFLGTLTESPKSLNDILSEFNILGKSLNWFGESGLGLKTPTTIFQMCSEALLRAEMIRSEYGIKVNALPE